MVNVFTKKEDKGMVSLQGSIKNSYILTPLIQPKTAYTHDVVQGAEIQAQSLTRISLTLKNI